MEQKIGKKNNADWPIFTMTHFVHSESINNGWNQNYMAYNEDDISSYIAPTILHEVSFLGNKTLFLKTHLWLLKPRSTALKTSWSYLQNTEYNLAQQ